MLPSWRDFRGLCVQDLPYTTETARWPRETKTPATEPGVQHRDVFTVLRPRWDVRSFVNAAATSLTFTTILCLAVLGVLLGFNIGTPELRGGLVPPLFVMMPLATVLLILDMRNGKRPIRWKCPNCDKTLSDDVEWTCGDCDHRTYRPSFLFRCGNSACGEIPKAYECPHCQALTYLTAERNGRHPAHSRVPDSKNAPTPEAVRAARATQKENYEHQIEELKYQIQVRDLMHRLTPLQVKDERQAQVDVALREMDRIIEECKAVAMSAPRQAEFNTWVDKQPGLDEQTRSDIKNLASTKFAHYRYQRGGELSMDEKRPSE